MIKSIFRLIWKRKRRSILMITEMFISFLLLFGLFTMVINNIKGYFEPTGFNYENVWVMRMNNISGAGLSDEQNKLTIDQLERNITTMPDVLSLSNTSGNFPYNQSEMSTNIMYNEKTVYPNVVNSDDAFAQVLGIDLKQGRWYNNNDDGTNETPIVINQKLKEALFGNEDAIGKIVSSGDDKYKIVGVVEHYKVKGEYSEEPNIFFTRMVPNRFGEVFLLKVKPGAGIAFEEELMNTASNIAKDWTIRLEPLSKYRNDAFQRTWIPILIFGGVCIFLILNIILGLLGVLWYNINNRIPEIGLRQSVGASAGKIYQQFIGEMLVLTTLGFIPGILVAIQFPLLHAFEVKNEIYVLSIFCSVFIIYMLVFISSFIPSIQAVKTQPAMALHEE